MLNPSGYRNAAYAAVGVPSIAEALMGEDTISPHGDLLGNDFADKVQKVIARVRATLPEPNDAEQAAIINVELSPTAVATRLCQGKSIEQVVTELVDHLRAELDLSAPGYKRQQVANSSIIVVNGALAELRVEKHDRSLSYGELTFDERARLEADLEQLADTGQYNPQCMRMERGMLRYDFAPGRYAYVDPASVRHTRVEKVRVGDEDFYQITRRALPEFSGGRISFSRHLDSGLVSVKAMSQKGINSADELREFLRNQDMEQTRKMLEEYSKMLKIRVDELVRAAKQSVQALKKQMQQSSQWHVGDVADVSLAHLGNLSSGVAVPMSSLMSALATDLSALALG